MKLKVLIFAITLTLASSAFAQFFPAKAFVTFQPAQVTVQVYNPYYEPIICNGQVFGRTFSGAVLTTYFTEQFMTAGSYRLAYVNTLPIDLFIAGWSNIHCRFARF